MSIYIYIYLHTCFLHTKVWSFMHDVCIYMCVNLSFCLLVDSLHCIILHKN